MNYKTNFDDIFRQQKYTVHPINLVHVQDLVKRYIYHLNLVVSCVFVYGSSSNGLSEQFSDIDIVIITNDNNVWKTRTDIFDSYLMDATFISLNKIDDLAEYCKMTAEPKPLVAISTGKIILDNDNLAESIQKKYRLTFEQGPSNYNKKIVDNTRGYLTSIALDLSKKTKNEVDIVFGVTVIPAITKIIFISRRDWLFEGRHAILKLMESYPSEFRSLDDAVRHLLNEDNAPLLKLIKSLLDGTGGAVWDRYERDFGAKLKKFSALKAHLGMQTGG